MNRQFYIDKLVEFDSWVCEGINFDKWTDSELVDEYNIWYGNKIKGGN